MERYGISCQCGETNWLSESQAETIFECPTCNGEYDTPSIDILRTHPKLSERVVPEDRPKRSKVEELAIFTAGFGLVIAAVVGLIWFNSDPLIAAQRPSGVFVMPLVAASVLILLGLVLRFFPNRNVAVVCLISTLVLFMVDTLLFFNFRKLIFSVAIMAIILKEGYAAVLELDSKAGIESEVNAE